MGSDIGLSIFGKKYNYYHAYPVSMSEKGKKRITIIITFILVLILFFVILNDFSNQKYPNKNISKILTTHLSDIEMYDDSLVYNEWEEGDAYLTYYKISTGEKRLIKKFESGTKAKIDGNYILYCDSSGIYRKIAIYDISNRKTSIYSNDELVLYSFPSINNGKIVWSDLRNDKNYDFHYESTIYRYDIKNDVEEELFCSPTEKIYPDIYGNNIAWVEIENDMPSIYLLELPGKQPIKIGEGYDPKIWGNYVLFGYKSLFLYSIKDHELKEIPEGSSFGSDCYDILNDKVVWVNGDFNKLMMYDIKKNKVTQIIKIEGEDRFIENPRIWDNKIIFYSNMDEDLSIYLYDPDSLIFGLEPMNFYYSIILIILIFTVIGVYIFKKIKSRKNNRISNYEAGVNIEVLTDQDDNKFQKFQCPNCRGTIKIEMGESPLILNCPHCGIKGEIKD
jgi:hypothetical protein